MKKNFLRYTTTILIFSILAGCSTKKNTWMSRNYHNLTAHYNVYFNGKESLKGGFERINTLHKENYADILPIFKYSDPQIASGITSEMDRTIKKSVACIKKHSITAKPKRKGLDSKLGLKDKKKIQEFYNKEEYCKWIDDAYLLMGKANFLKHDFFPAIKSLEIVNRKFSEEKTTHEADLWLARTYIEMEKYNDAERYLEKIKAKEKIPEKIKGDFYLVYADFYMRQRKYSEVIPKLEKAVEIIPKRDGKARYIFILAQLHQKLGEPDKATELYKNVIATNPEYELAFNAKINLAISVKSEGEGNDNIKMELLKMLKDEKNLDYQDQIYYALANLEQKEGNLQEAIEYYKLSASKSTINENQKAMAYLALAEIFFEKPNYNVAQAYYDSTMFYLNENYSEYDKVSTVADNLNDLVENLEVIHTQDSLQKVAMMPEDERMKLIEQIIENVEKEEERKKQQMEAMKNQGGMYRYGQDDILGGRSDMTTKGKWYFYNPSALALGKTEFQKKWGKRKLEDNWRRKNKSTMGGEIAVEEEEVYRDSLGNILTNKDPEYYMVQLPLNDSLMEVSHEKIRDAYFRVGEIYWQQLDDYQEAIDIFIELDKEYPNSSHTISVYYSLYQLYTIIENEQMANKYKQMIVDNYPNSHIAKMLSNPNYVKELNESKNAVEKLYIETYENYRNSNYPEVIEAFQAVKQKYPNNILMPKFDFLRTLSIASNGDTAQFKDNLEQIIVKYPDSEVKHEAEKILSVFVEKQKEHKEKMKQIAMADKEIYSFNPDTSHLFVMVLKNKTIDINKLKFELTDFNLDFKREKDFEIQEKELNEGTKLIVVGTIDDGNESVEYINSLFDKKKELFSSYSKADYSAFTISEKNFEVFAENKDIERYLNFFTRNYQQQKNNQ